MTRPDLCAELLEVTVGPVPEGGCPACIEMGDSWVHLRFCVTCGAIGCCNDSKNQHARKHAVSGGHPVIRSKEPGEFWAYCFDHDAGRALQPPG
jgi:CPA2 family monovalent cation:H+ antiporter-2